MLNRYQVLTFIGNKALFYDFSRHEPRYLQIYDDLLEAINKALKAIILSKLQK